MSGGAADNEPTTPPPDADLPNKDAEPAESSQEKVDPLDERLPCVIPILCRGKDCTRIFMPEHLVSFSTTPRKIISELRSVGWTWTEGAKPTSGIPRCAECSAKATSVAAE